MKNKKRIALGTLSAVTALAAPIATVISCGSDKETKTHLFKYESIEGDGMGRNFVISPEQNDPNINQLMTKHNGKWKFKEASQIPDSNLDGVGTIRLNIFLNDHVRQELNIARKEVIKEYGNTNKVGSISIAPSKDGNPEFFEKFTSSPGEAKKLNAKIERLEKNTEFRLAFNLIIPKWWKTDFGDDGMALEISSDAWDSTAKKSIDFKSDSRGYFYDQIESVVAEDSSTNIQEIYIEKVGIRNFNSHNLSSKLTWFSLSGNQLKSFDSTTLPPKLTVLDLKENLLTSFDTSKLPQSLVSIRLKGNKFPKEVQDKIDDLKDKINKRS